MPAPPPLPPGGFADPPTLVPMGEISRPGGYAATVGESSSLPLKSPSVAPPTSKFPPVPPSRVEAKPGELDGASFRTAQYQPIDIGSVAPPPKSPPPASPGACGASAGGDGDEVEGEIIGNCCGGGAEKNNGKRRWYTRGLNFMTSSMPMADSGPCGPWRQPRWQGYEGFMLRVPKPYESDGFSIPGLMDLKPSTLRCRSLILI